MLDADWKKLSLGNSDGNIVDKYRYVSIQKQNIDKYREKKKGYIFKTIPFFTYLNTGDEKIYLRNLTSPGMFFICFKVSDEKKSETEVRNFQENLENLCYNFCV